MEFALVMPVLFMLIFGIIDYGLLFNDSINLRQGAREGARQAVVQQGTCNGTGYTNMACLTKAASKSVLSAADPAVKIYPSTTWAQGSQLVVCVQVKEKSLTGFVPFPASGILKSRTVMSIETASPVPAGTGYQDAAPAGGDWSTSWC